MHATTPQTPSNPKTSSTTTAVLMGAAAAFLVGVLGASSLSVMADGDPTTDTVPEQIAYRGVLEINGEPVNATGENAVWLEFALYNSLEPEANPVYRQSMTVEVYGGNFTASIGPSGTGPGGVVQIQDVVRAADALYLGMTLLGDPDDPDDDVAMNNRQHILATPFAMWSNSATTFDVATDLTVGRDLQVAGDLNAQGGVTVLGELETRDVHIHGDIHAESPLRFNSSISIPDGNLNLTNGNVVLSNGSIVVPNSSGNPTFLRDFIIAEARSYVRTNCVVYFGNRDDCEHECGRGPEVYVGARANGTCAGGGGPERSCPGNWSAWSPRGTLNGDDTMYIRLVCD